MEKSFVKGLAVLEALARAGRPCGVTELARDLGITKSNAHRLLQTLVATGFARHDGALGLYTAAPKLWELGMRVLAHVEVRDIASPLLRQLARRSGESINLAIRDGIHVLFIERLENGETVRGGYVGVRAPAHALATGKVLLAFAPEAVQQEAARRPQAFTPRTITSGAALLAELAQVRGRGHASNRGEWREMVNSIAAPLWDGKPEPVAAIGITGPKPRMTLARQRELLPLLLESAAAISRRLGGSAAGAAPAPLGNRQAP
jgi:DNA-binding IclR family transcriptional regulator